jgi:hypothetical protein
MANITSRPNGENTSGLGKLTAQQNRKIDLQLRRQLCQSHSGAELKNVNTCGWNDTIQHWPDIIVMCRAMPNSWGNTFGILREELY